MEYFLQMKVTVEVTDALASTRSRSRAQTPAGWGKGKRKTDGETKTLGLSRDASSLLNKSLFHKFVYDGKMPKI